jgi:hypothetical protein
MRFEKRPFPEDFMGTFITWRFPLAAAGWFFSTADEVNRIFIARCGLDEPSD